MILINARNVQQALPIALEALGRVGVDRDSRNGPVRMFPEPVTTVYRNPRERVMFWAARDANPFFHFWESLWMLAGRDDVEGVARFVNRMRSFSDDGVTLHGAYGRRWRSWFDIDQLPTIIEALKANRDDRRQVLSMWDARTDLGRQGKDLPCNLQAVFGVSVTGALDMMVTNRSNDLVWGAYGANAVHFSMLHEYMANAAGYPVGVYRQVSANFHAYKDTLKQVASIAGAAPDPLTPPEFRMTGQDPYTDGAVKPYPIMTVDRPTWDRELLMFMSEPNAVGFLDPFFRRVAGPIIRAHEVYKESSDASRYAEAREILADCRATDWKLACTEWLTRREEHFKARLARANDDGVVYD
jgi:hypothetical protein